MTPAFRAKQEANARRKTDRQTDIRTDRQTDRQTCQRRRREDEGRSEKKKKKENEKLVRERKKLLKSLNIIHSRLEVMQMQMIFLEWWKLEGIFLRSSG